MISPGTRQRLGPLRTGPALVLAVTVAVGAVVALGLRSPATPGPVATTAVTPTSAPALSGATLDGGRFDLADARGHVLLVNVFASWCGPCRDELPLLVDTERRWSPQGLRLVALNVRDGTEAVRALLEETGARGLTVLPDPEGTRAVDWGVRAVPETFVVDRDGRIVDRQQGVVTRQWLEQRVAPLLAG
ncbi:cytochrome c biogenesis protein CcmG, thiol:disulfide interchange protein DsbE [Micromonospora purpureochromogenes]|uniref:Cytochrome c biogenesis protein CcmG, thiol:disulfide interchange protein DsbE n=1 Tax=Micromonospora purpureochromogenes TaxID=47872 RepID=A0A1C4ZRN3_9ACTN|nr:TlpA disulfide reductase family protein [Micromonospora purpureochromogenes]SCF35717.1 cytochrome c biogenesis protein CcmG, thiol:disulfide interchange protein DsbE [Micromonospora purpureochromogenes]